MPEKKPPFPFHSANSQMELTKSSQKSKKKSLKNCCQKIVFVRKHFWFWVNSNSSLIRLQCLISSQGLLKRHQKEAVQWPETSSNNVFFIKILFLRIICFAMAILSVRLFFAVEQFFSISPWNYRIFVCYTILSSWRILKSVLRKNIPYWKEILNKHKKA